MHNQLLDNCNWQKQTQWLARQRGETTSKIKGFTARDQSRVTTIKHIEHDNSAANLIGGARNSDQGVNQQIPAFKIADAALHADLLAVAQRDARVLVESDPTLTSPRGQAARLALHLFDQLDPEVFLGSG